MAIILSFAPSSTPVPHQNNIINVFRSRQAIYHFNGMLLAADGRIDLSVASVVGLGRIWLPNWRCERGRHVRRYSLPSYSDAGWRRKRFLIAYR
jgi:hypothetical protein